MANEPIKQVNKLMVGQLDFSFLPGCVPAIPGTSVLNGPVWIGAGVPIPTANCMIGPGLNPVTLQVTGISNFLGPITNITGVVNRYALTNASGVTIKTGISIKQALSAVFGLKTNAAVQITSGAKVCHAVLVTPLLVADAIAAGPIKSPTIVALAAAIAAKKPFDIQHPTKQKWRLRHVCIEGPTADVYVRGTLKSKNVIELPDYWINLVHAESITVNLSPVGQYQELFVEKIECGTKVYIKNNSGSDINCHYTVYGERKDTSKNIPEYAGTSLHDYPGDNSQYGINGSSK